MPLRSRLSTGAVAATVAVLFAMAWAREYSQGRPKYLIPITEGNLIIAPFFP